MTLKLGDALGKADYPAVELKVTALIASGECTAADLARWIEGKGEGARQIPCANNFLSWPEYECYRKYNPDFNKLSKS
jgi:hypothetical protein